MVSIATASNVINSGISNQLTVSDYIQLFGIIASLITSVIAIIISVKTLKQNSEMIEESSRPYVAVYSGITNCQSPSYYIIVKNFGQSGAYITDFSCDFDLSKCSFNENRVPFSHMAGTFISPGQSFICNVRPEALFKNSTPITFFLKYRFNEKEYCDSFALNFEADLDLVQTRACTKDKELRTISYALQDISEKML